MRAMAQPLLSAAMIVRNEARHLPDCLASLRGVVDEIVLVDTGSTDATIEIARACGARVFEHEWRDDFAPARNLGLDRARGRWILYIDADERLRPIARADVEARLADATEVSLRVRLRAFAGSTPHWEHRLWRADPRIRFAGTIHEKVAPAIAALARSDDRRIGEGPLELDHAETQDDQTRKHARYAPMLRAALAADPGDIYNWRHLAHVLDGLGDPRGAEQALLCAAALSCRTRPVTGSLAFAELVHRRVACGDDAAALIEEGLRHYPDNAALIWQQARADIQAGRHAAALQWLDRLDMDVDMPVEDTIAYPAELFAADVPDARGLCLFRLGRYREAADAYRRAEAFEPASQARRARRVLAEHRAAAGAPWPAAPKARRWAAPRVLNGVTVDLGGVPVALRASDGMRAQAIRSELGYVPLSHDEPVAQVFYGAHSGPLPASEPDEAQGDLRLWVGDGAVVVGHRSGMTAHVCGGVAEIGGYAPDLRRAFGHVASFALAALLAEHGCFLMHAAAIGRADATVLVLGDSGDGKSTLAAGARADGWSVLSDDLVLVRCGVQGPRVTGLAQPLAVPAEALPPGHAASGLPTDRRGRVVLPVDDHSPGWRAVTAIARVGHGEEDEPVVSRIPRHELLAPALRAMLARQPGTHSARFALAVTLAELPGLRLQHGRVADDRGRRGVRSLSAGLAVSA